MEDSQEVKDLISKKIEETVDCIFKELKLGVKSNATNSLKLLLKEVESLDDEDKRILFNSHTYATNKIDTIFTSKSVTILSNNLIRKHVEGKRDKNRSQKAYSNNVERIEFLCTEFLNRHINKKLIQDNVRNAK